jgi:hypothetical protein
VPSSPVAAPGLSIKALPSVLGGAPSPNTIITIEKSAKQAGMDLHYPARLQMRLPLDVKLPESYGATVQVVGHGDGATLNQYLGRESQLHLGIPFDQSRFMSVALPLCRTILNVLPASYIQYLQMILGTLDISISLLRQPHHRDYQELFSGPVSVKTKVGFVISNPDEDTQSWSDDSSSESGGSQDGSHHGDGDSGNGRFQPGASTHQTQRNGSQVTQSQLFNVLKKTMEAGTALLVFALTRFKFVVESLLSFIPLKATLTNGATPLHFAALSAPRDVFEVLLSSPDSADAVRMRDNDWNTPLNIAEQLQRRNIINLILRRFPGMNVELVEDLFFTIGPHFDFATARLFTLTCKSAYTGLVLPTHLFGSAPTSGSSGKVYYVRAGADAPVARTLGLVNDLLLKNQAVYLHLDADESRYIPSVLTQWGKALLSNERLQALNISTIGREAGQERHLWTRAFAKATAATISLKTGEIPPGLSASVMAQLSDLRLTYVTPANGPDSFVRTFAGLKKLHLDGSFDPAWLLSVMQHPQLESLSLFWEEIPISSFGPCTSRLNLKSLSIEADEETINNFATLIPHLQNLTALTLMSRATLDSAFLELTSLRSLSLDGWIGLGSSHSLRDWISKSTRLETLNLRIDDMEQPESSPEDFAFDFGAVKNRDLIVQLFSWCSISASLRTATRLEHLTLIGNETTDSASEVTAALRQLSTLKTVTKSLGPDSARPHQTIVMHRAFTFENEPLSIDDGLLKQREDSNLLHLKTLHAELTQDDVPKAIELLVENSSTLREIRLNYSEVDSDFSGPILPTPPHQLSVLQSLELRFPPIRSLLEHRS